MVPDPPTLDGAIALVFVVDSSLTLSSMWGQLIHEYFSPIMRRITETSPGINPKNLPALFRVAFITYGTPDRIPTPLICKRFFTDYTTISKIFKDESMRLGIGQTNSGGTCGMSALEGLVAALEFFDTLDTCAPPNDPNRPHLHHIIHVAAAPPDMSEHPQYNDLPALDDLSWSTLPLEIQKRHIHYNYVGLKPDLPKFGELFRACTPTPTSTWFPVRTGHTILLESSLAFSPGHKGPKRPGEGTNSPEANKRPRLSEPSPLTSQTSPPTVPMNPPSAPPIPSAQNPPPPPSSQDAAALINLANGPLASMSVEQLQMRARHIEGQMSQLRKQYEELQKEPARLAAMRPQFEKRSQSLMHVRNLLMNMIQKHLQNAQRPNPVKPAGPSTSPPHISPSQPPQPKLPPQPPQSNLPPQTSQSNLPPNPTAHDAPDLAKYRATSASVPPPSSNPSNNMPPVPQHMTAQMQKLVEQQERSRSGQSNIGAPGGVGPSMNADVMMSRPQMPNMGGLPGNPGMLQQGLMGEAKPGPSVLPGRPGSQIVWQGALAWSGQDQNGMKKDVSTYVIGSVTTSTQPHYASTWPTTLNLTPSREPAILGPDLRTWLERHHPTLCTFQPRMDAPDPESNTANFKSLITLLAQRRFFASASWKLGNGQHGPGALIININGGALLGAFFPMNGVPELPKPPPAIAQGQGQLLTPAATQGPGQLPTPGPTPSIPNRPQMNLPPQLLQFLSRLDPSQQSQAMQRYNLMMQQQRAHQQHQQQQQQAAMNANQSNFMAMNAAQQMQGMQAMQQQFNPQAAFNNMGGGGGGMNFGAMGMGTNANASMSRPMGGGGPGGGMQGVPFEILQSFMQRNQENSG